jgi:DNA mismatch endonuclease (patch repair protein)
MADVHDQATRRRNMAAIRSRDTLPELTLRRTLHGLGYRYRLHVKGLPGRPDIVLPKHRAIVFVHGCFFHMHQCRAFKWPATRAEFWRQKISANAARDRRTEAKLMDQGWRVGIVWECSLRVPRNDVANRLAKWLGSSRSRIEL